MEDKYLPDLSERIYTINEQINECKRIIYRNLVENLTFTKDNEKAKIKEVEYNNETLKEKVDTLLEEKARLEKI